MRKFLFSFLILLMLMPSLACAMPACVDKTQDAAAEQPCAGHGSHHISFPQSDIKKINLLKDCMGVDLQTADAHALKKPDISQEHFFIVTADAHVVTDPTFHDVVIRGPPPDWPAFNDTRPPLLLTTLRFRI